MKILTNLLKDKRDEWLVNTTSLINDVNPIVDRLMNDDSVSGVIMTNNEGHPILTNASHTITNRYSRNLHEFGQLAQNYIKEFDPLDEVLVIRLKTQKSEMLMAPNPEFNIIVVQHVKLG